MPEEIAGGCLRAVLGVLVELFIRDPLVWLFSKKGDASSTPKRRLRPGRRK